MRAEIRLKEKRSLQRRGAKRTGWEKMQKCEQKGGKKNETESSGDEKHSSDK